MTLESLKRIIYIALLFSLVPYMASADFQSTWNVEFLLNGTTIGDGNQYVFPVSTLLGSTYIWPGGNAYGDVFRGDPGNSAIINGHFLSSSGTKSEADSFPAFDNYFVAIYGSNGVSLTDAREWFQTGTTTNPNPALPANFGIIRFELVEELDPPIDPLILQYEPILYLHPDENYQPMNVEAFIEASALWDDNDLLPDTIIKNRSDINPVTIEDIGVSGSEDWYLAFSGEAAKTFDSAVAKSKYDQLIANGAATTTYYAYKTEDSFTDDEGVLHEFVVLQYWYFYAFNDWAVHGGINNHEGDWESVFVFLDKATEEPKYIAYSSHLNDGDPGSIFQFDSVRRSWGDGEIEKDGDQIKSFVAVGSHANYPSNGINGVHDIPRIEADDLTSTGGDHLETNSWIARKNISATDPLWMIYEGKWGADAAGIGAQGPQGPNFLAPILGGGIARFHHPIEWAGIDKALGEKLIITPTDTLTFTNQTTVMVFTEPLLSGATVSVDLHDEIISFGDRSDGTTLLAHFWDIESSLVDDTFEVEIALQYDPDELALLEVEENNLSVFLYNEAANLWERVDSVIDAITNTISFTTTHFSRYAIGAEETPTIEELIEIFKERVATSDIRDSLKRKLEKRINKIQTPLAKEKNDKALKKIQKLEKQIEKQTEKGKINSEVSARLLEILDSIKQLIPREEQELECDWHNDWESECGGDGWEGEYSKQEGNDF